MGETAKMCLDSLQLCADTKQAGENEFARLRWESRGTRGGSVAAGHANVRAAQTEP